jgi:hypothetical protein
MLAARVARNATLRAPRQRSWPGRGVDRRWRWGPDRCGYRWRRRLGSWCLKRRRGRQHAANFGIAGGAKYLLICDHHPENAYRTENPRGWAIFVEVEGKDCSCPSHDPLVTRISDDLTNEPFGAVTPRRGFRRSSRPSR